MTPMADNNKSSGRRWLVSLAAVVAASLVGCAPGKWTAVTDRQDFERRLSSTSQPVMVDFYMNACPHCVILAPRLDQLAAEYDGRVTFLRVEKSQVPGLPAQYGISGFPTVLLFVHGVKQGRWAGDGTPKEVFTQALEQALSQTKHP